MRKFWPWLLLVVIALLVNLPILSGLEIADRKTGDLLAFFPVRTGEQFTIRFTHSIAKTPVDELFRVDPSGDIVLYETDYQSFGAGLPFDVEGKERLLTENGHYRLVNMDRHLPDFLMAVGTVANHQLLIKGKQIPFTQFAQPGESVRISIKKHSALTYLLKGGLTWRTKISS
jgi:hypothetical protein